MSELRPYPFDSLIRRLFSDIEKGEQVFDLPARKIFLGPDSADFSATMHGHRVSTALGPAAGPQTQMAQNLVLSWLSGCRIMELKTVQINDQLEIPRPCIDMQNVGYNVEWSQELRLQESLEEYVKGSMLIEMIIASGKLKVSESYQDMLFDMSVGYDLAGIKSAPVDAFIEGMKDCSEIVEKLRLEIPEEFGQLRDLDFNTCLSDSLTLSTFHGCPPDEIEKIMEYLLVEKGLHAIVKLNPTLLGPDAARTLLNETLGYTDIQIPDAAFANDTKWEQAIGIVERLAEVAKAEGKSFGVKFSNTLLVDNHKDFFPAQEKSMYLSGPPLHVFAMTLVEKFREHFWDALPISFSAGIDRNNFSDAIAIGLTPVTVCSDLLKPGGYARASGYLDVLGKRMAKVSATSVEDFILLAYGEAKQTLDSLGANANVIKACQTALLSGSGLQEAAGELYPGWVSATRLANTRHYVSLCRLDERYRQTKNHKTPKKVGSPLALFDCVSCNKCIPVCPNDANFSYTIPKQELTIVKMSSQEGQWTASEEGQLQVEKKVQYGNFADFCNECGNCDIFCPEDGGPYVIKGRFFGNLDDWRTMKDHDGFFFLREKSSGADSLRIYGRFSGQEYEMQEQDGRVDYRGKGFEVAFDSSNPVTSFSGSAEGEVDLSYYHLMSWIATAVLDSSSDNYLRYL